MDLKNKVTKKRGLAALLITGAVVGVSLGATRLLKRLTNKNQNQMN